MGTFPLARYEMSFHTQNRLQDSCNLLTEAEQEGAFLKAQFAGRVALIATSAVLHAEFLARCVLMIGLTLINSVVEFKKEQISIQAKQAYTALCMSAMCFYVLLQPHMLRSIAGWVDRIKAPQIRASIEEVSINQEKSNVQKSPLFLKKEKATILSPLFPSEKEELDRVNRIKEMGHQFDQSFIEQDVAAIIGNTRKLALLEMEKEFSGLDLQLKYNSLLKDSLKFSNVIHDRFPDLYIEESISQEIQTLVGEIAISLKNKEVKFRILGLFEPITGPRASLYLKNHIQQELINQFKLFAHKEDLDDADIFSACQKAYRSLQEGFISFSLNCRIHPALPSIAESLSSMTVALIGDDFGYVLNVGHSKALLNVAQDCIPLSLSADPDVQENTNMIEARGGKVCHGLVNYALNSATAFGGASTNGIVGALVSFTKFSKQEVSSKGSLFLGSSAIFSKLGQKGVSDFYAENSIEAGDRADALTGSLIHSNPDISHVGCLILTFGRSERISTPESRPGSRLSGISFDSFPGMDDESLSPLSNLSEPPYRVKERFSSEFDLASSEQKQPSPLSSQTSSFIDLDNMDEEILRTSSLASETEEKELSQEVLEISSNASYDVISEGEAKEQAHPNAWGFSALFGWPTRTKSESDTESFEEIDVKALESDSSPELGGENSELDSLPSPLSSSFFEETK